MRRFQQSAAGYGDQFLGGGSTAPEEHSPPRAVEQTDVGTSLSLRYHYDDLWDLYIPLRSSLFWLRTLRSCYAIGSFFLLGSLFPFISSFRCPGFLHPTSIRGALFSEKPAIPPWGGTSRSRNAHRQA